MQNFSLLYSARGTFSNWGLNGVGYEKGVFLTEKWPYLVNDEIGPRLLLNWSLMRSRILAFKWP